MVESIDILFGALVLIGLVLCALSVSAHRHWDQLGVGYLAVVALLLGLGGILGGLFGIVFDPRHDEMAMPLWGEASILLWAVASVPWLLFALAYTGRYTDVRWRTVGLLYLPFAGFVANVVWHQLDTAASIANLVSSTVFIYCLALVLLGVFVLVQSARSYPYLTTLDGLALSSGPVLIVLSLNTVGMLQQASLHFAVGLYAITLLVGTAGFAHALVWSNMFARTPAVETRAERAIANETDDLVFVIDDADYIVRCNETARRTLDRSESDILRESTTTVLTYTVATLRDMETVTLDTVEGKRQYDPQVSPINDDTGRALGAVVSLRDVTERELREERLAVLNRILRHNLRNQVDIIKSHAEVLARDREDGHEHARAIEDAADRITDLGYEARAIGAFIADTRHTREVDIVTVIEDTCETLEVADRDVTVRRDTPESAPVVTNLQALEAALQSAIDNAVRYGESRVDILVESVGDGYEVAVRDDGRGIPDRELESLAGAETQHRHGTGLGLWQLKWAVRTMGGDLSFETADGTTVGFTVPAIESQGG